MFGFYVAADEAAVEHAVGELMFGTHVLCHGRRGGTCQARVESIPLLRANLLGISLRHLGTGGALLWPRPAPSRADVPHRWCRCSGGEESGLEVFERRRDCYHGFGTSPRSSFLLRAQAHEHDAPLLSWTPTG